MKKLICAFIFLSFLGCKPSEEKESTSSTVDTGLDRTVLPIKEPTYPAESELDARNAKAPARFEVKAPEKAPNVVIVLIDDIGFGHSSAFGGHLLCSFRLG